MYIIIYINNIIQYKYTKRLLLCDYEQWDDVDNNKLSTLSTSVQ